MQDVCYLGLYCANWLVVLWKQATFSALCLPRLSVRCQAVNSVWFLSAPYTIYIYIYIYIYFFFWSKYKSCSCAKLLQGHCYVVLRYSDCFLHVAMQFCVLLHGCLPAQKSLTHSCKNWFNPGLFLWHSGLALVPHSLFFEDYFFVLASYKHLFD